MAAFTTVLLRFLTYKRHLDPIIRNKARYQNLAFSVFKDKGSMRLNRLFNDCSQKVLYEYVLKLKTLKKPRLLSESVKEDIVGQAIGVGEFDNPHWVKQLLNGLKQVGVHGISMIPEEDRPITIGEMKKIVSAILELVSNA